MSDLSLNLKMQALGSNKRLSAFYDFSYSSSEIDALGSAGVFTGVLPNSSQSHNPSLHTGYVLGSQGSDEPTSKAIALNLLNNDKLNLSASNLQIPLHDQSLNKLSMILDFEFSQSVNNGILVGCLKKGSETVDNVAHRNSEGFNVGVTDRGHLFCQTFSSEGDSINVFKNIELSKRNLVGVSVSENALSVSYFDYFNSLTKKVEIPIDKDYTSDVDSIVIGGSDDYFRSSSAATPTFSGSLNHLAIFSGFFEGEILQDLGESFLSDYVYVAESSVTQQRVTGYSETITYRTGITGHNYSSTGTLTIETGRETFTGSFSAGSSSNKKEGDRIYKYYTLNNGDVKTFYKEELGQLHSNSGYLYYPTGEGAYDTLGLNDISQSIQSYSEVTGMSREGGSSSIIIDLYEKTPLVGVLSEISGVVRSPLQESFNVVTPASSGFSFVEPSEKLKKDYIYYMGERS